MILQLAQDFLQDAKSSGRELLQNAHSFAKEDPVSFAAVSGIAAVGLYSFNAFRNALPYVKKHTNVDGDVIVVGAGVGGAALATSLARQGFKVLLVERSMDEPDRIVGELMQPGGVDALRKLGLTDALKDIDAVDVLGYVVHRGGEYVKLTHPKIDGKQPMGSSFVHGRLITGLRKLALKEPNVTVIEGSVSDLIEEEGAIRGVTYTRRGDPSTVYQARAPLTFLIDGLGSKFRSRMVRSPAQSRSYFTGCIIEDTVPVDSRYAEVCLTPEAPVLVYPIAPRLHRVLVDIPAPLPNMVDGSLKEYFMTKIVPHVPKHVQGPLVARLNVEDDQSHNRLRAMQCTFLPAAPVIEPGAILLGDAYNMRHPLTGGGMTVLLKDIVVMNEIIKEDKVDLHDHEAVMKMYAKLHWRRKEHCFVVNVLSMALSALFSGYTENLRYLRDSCFEYFQAGGECVDGPMRLLGVTRPSPMTLVYHFFSVAVRATSVICRSRPTYLVPVSLLQSGVVLGTAASIIFPLIASEFYSPVFRKTPVEPKSK